VRHVVHDVRFPLKDTVCEISRIGDIRPVFFGELLDAFIGTPRAATRAVDGANGASLVVESDPIAKSERFVR
jgi:hypothetical protein